MVMEKSKWKSHEDESTNAEDRGGLTRSSEEATKRWWSEGVELSSFERSVNYCKVGGTFGQNKTV
jgi:hypothetical protein